MLSPVTIKNEEFEEIIQKVDGMYFKAEHYCPTGLELGALTQEEFKNCIPFLFWVEWTGDVTESNKKDRKLLTRFLRNFVIIEDDLDKN